MTLDSALNGLSGFLMKAVGFLFGTGWGIFLIVLGIFLYFIFKGAGVKEEVQSPDKATGEETLDKSSPVGDSE